MRALVLAAVLFAGCSPHVIPGLDGGTGGGSAGGENSGAGGGTGATGGGSGGSIGGGSGGSMGGGTGGSIGGGTGGSTGGSGGAMGGGTGGAGCGVVCSGTDSFCSGSCGPPPCDIDAGSCGTFCCGVQCCAPGDLCCVQEGPITLGEPVCVTPSEPHPTCPQGCAPLCVSDRNL